MSRTVISAIFVLLLIGSTAFAQDWGDQAEVERLPYDDWAFEPSLSSFEFMAAKKSTFFCARLGDFVRTFREFAAEKSRTRRDHGGPLLVSRNRRHARTHVPVGFGRIDLRKTVQAARRSSITGRCVRPST